MVSQEGPSLVDVVGFGLHSWDADSSYLGEPRCASASIPRQNLLSLVASSAFFAPCSPVLNGMLALMDRKLARERIHF